MAFMPGLDIATALPWHHTLGEVFDEKATLINPVNQMSAFTCIPECFNNSF